MQPLILPTLLISVLYCARQEPSRYQATLGKRPVGLQVVDMHEHSLTFSLTFPRAIARAVAKQASALTFGVGVFCGAFHPPQAGAA